MGRGRYPTSRPEGDPRAEQRFNEIRPGPSARSLLLRLPFLLLLFHLGLLHLAWRAFVPFRGGSVRLWAEGTEGDSEGSAAETTARDSPAPGAPACGEPYLCFHVGVAGAAAGVRGAAVTAALLVGGGAVRPGPRPQVGSPGARRGPGFQGLPPPPPGGMCLVLRGLTLILSAAPASDAPCTLEGLCLWSPTWPVPWGFLESRAVERSWVGWCRCSACAFGGGCWFLAWPPAPQMPHFPGAHLRPGRTPWW